jgi:hypothetical protein
MLAPSTLSYHLQHTQNILIKGEKKQNVGGHKPNPQK